MGRLNPLDEEHGGVSDELRILGSPAAEKAARRMLENGRHIRGAFDSLELGWDFDDFAAYASGAPFLDDLPDDLFGKVVGAMAAAAIVAVERSRELDPHFTVDPPDPL